MVSNAFEGYYSCIRLHLRSLTSTTLLFRGVVFLEYWKRTESAVAMRWGMTEYEANEESRPEFDRNPNTKSIDSPINGIDEKDFPRGERKKRMAFSATVVFLFMVLNHSLTHWHTNLLTRYIVSCRWCGRVNLYATIPVVDSREGLWFICCVHS